jgi:hypothetical protein
LRLRDRSTIPLLLKSLNHSSQMLMRELSHCRRITTATSVGVRDGWRRGSPAKTWASVPTRRRSSRCLVVGPLRSFAATPSLNSAASNCGWRAAKHSPSEVQAGRFELAGLVTIAVHFVTQAQQHQETQDHRRSAQFVAGPGDICLTYKLRLSRPSAA